MSRGSSTQTSVAVGEPWSAQQPFLKEGFAGAQNLYKQGGPQFFPGKTYVDFSPETTRALDMTANRATAGSPLLQASQTALKDTASGNYLNANPYLDSMFNNAARGVTRQFREATMPGIGSQFSLAGRYGSGAHQNAVNQAQDALGTSLGSLASDIYGGNYANERSNQMKAAALAPTVAQQDYFDIGQLAQVGAQREAQQQLGVTEDINRFNFDQMRPYDALSRYLGYISGNYGGTNTQTSPLYRNQAAGALGGALGGAALANAAGVSPMYGIPVGLLAGLL